MTEARTALILGVTGGIDAARGASLIVHAVNPTGLSQPGVSHAWAYLPDLAETMAQLIERGSTLEAFETFHLEDHWDADGSHMAQAIRAAAANGNPRANIPVHPFPWPLVGLLSPFVTLFREMREMQYLWRQPLRLSNQKLLSALAAEARTPLVEAVSKTLAGLGCLQGA